MGMNIEAVRSFFVDACYNSAPLSKKSSAAKNMINFFRAGAQNPSVAKAIAGNEANKTFLLPVRACQQWFYNYNILKKHPAVKPEYQKFEAAYATMYPRTGRLREALINNSRISFNKVLPKMSAAEKTALKGAGA